MRFIKFVKLIGYSYVCNSLTNFEYKLKCNDRKRKLCGFAETCLEKSLENHLKGAYFWRVLAIWNSVTDQTTTRLSCLVVTWSSSRNQLAYVALSL